MQSLIEVPKQKYDCVIWDIRNQKLPVTIGGQEYCNHEILEENQCINCGAYKGLIKQMDNKLYSQFILTEIAISPSVDITIFVSSKQLGDNVKLLKSHLTTPEYIEFLWISRLGNHFKPDRQRITYLIFHSKSGKKLDHSKILVNPKGFDDRLYSFGKTLVINPFENWIYKSSNIDYITDEKESL